MKVGFTGTRSELTCEQHHALCALVRRLNADAKDRITEFHHGCCVGADDEANSAVLILAAGAKHVAHPPENGSLVSRDARDFADEIRPAMPYLDRNHAIVNACELLVACPKGMLEEQRSGTWATVRYARKQKKRIVIVYPDGTVTEE